MPQALTARRLDHVLIPRWSETDEWQVVDEDGQHYWVVNATQGSKERQQIYKVHCYTTVALSMANRDRRVARAAKIGRTA